MVLRSRSVPSVAVTLLLMALISPASAQRWAVLTEPKAPGFTRIQGPSGLLDAWGPRGLAIGPDGSLYVSECGAYLTDWSRHSRLRKRDAQGQWTVLAEPGVRLGQVNAPAGLAVDSQGTLYVADFGNSRVVQLAASGVWSVVAEQGDQPDQVNGPLAVRVDGAGDLYVADAGHLHRRDAGGHWALDGSWGDLPVWRPNAASLALAQDGSLWLSEVSAIFGASRNQLHWRNPQGQWAVIDQGPEVTGLALDGDGNLYVAEPTQDRVRKRDPRGNWTVVAARGELPGQVLSPEDVALDAAGRLYIADAGNGRVQRFDPRATPAPLLGDVDGDGQVALFDALGLLRVVVGYAEPGPETRAAADLDHDDGLSLRDALLLLRKVAGIP